MTHADVLLIVNAIENLSTAVWVCGILLAMIAAAAIFK